MLTRLYTQAIAMGATENSLVWINSLGSVYKITRGPLTGTFGATIYRVTRGALARVHY